MLLAGAGWSPGGAALLGGFFCWSGHPLLLLPLDLECPSLPGVEVKPRWAWQGAAPAAGELTRAGVQEFLAGILGLPRFVHSGTAFPWKAAREGQQRCFPRGLRPRKPDPVPEQTEQVGWRWGKGLEAGLEMMQEPHQPHLGVIFLPLGIPTGCVAAPAEVSSSCGRDEGCGAGSAAWSLLRGCPNGSGRGQRWEGSPHSQQAPKAAPEKRQKPQIHFASGFLSAQLVGPRPRGWGCGGGRGVPRAGRALMGVPNSRDTSWHLLPGWRMEMLTLLDAFSCGKRIFWG